MQTIRALLIGTAVLAMVTAVSSIAASEDLVREPRYAGPRGFYPSDPGELRRQIEHLTEKAKATMPQFPSDGRLRALILPHAGYIYSGWTAAHAGPLLHRMPVEKVILMGPDHRIGFRNGAISHAAFFRTPLGSVPVAGNDRSVLFESNLFRNIAASDRTEHSLEVIVPLLQYYCGAFQLLPITLGPCDIRRIASAIGPLIDKKTMLVASTDLSHYLTDEEAAATDAETIRIILDRNIQGLLAEPHRACGRYPTAVLLQIARQFGWKPVLLHYSNSGDTAGDRSRVVGYAAIAFFEEKHMDDHENQSESLTEKQGRALVRLARQTLQERLDVPVDPDAAATLQQSLQHSVFQNHRGTFVTLHKDGALRGCIGSLTAHEPLSASVRSNAVNAAFRDPRFPPVSSEELGSLDIEISILTTPHPLRYRDSEDLLRNLRVGIDGVIIRKGGASATFLPQVWKQLPRPDGFLSHLCQKAGLPADAWRTGDLEVLTYQVQYFEELSHSDE